MSNRCVHITSEEEFKFVEECIDHKFQHEFNEDYNCIWWEEHSYGSYKYAINDAQQIYTFDEWCKLTNNYPINYKLKEKGMIKQVLDILEKTYSNIILRNNTVPLLMSNPGMGKSTILEQFAKEKGVRMLSTILSTRMPNEVCGGLMPNHTTKSWEMYDSYELASLKDGDIWFIDECFNGVLKQTLDAVLNLLEGRTLPSGKKLANIMIIAASNPQGLINLTPQIKERFIRYDLKFEPSEYQAYLKSKYGMPESISAHLCTLISKEKFDSASWDYVTPRSVEKALNQIGCDLESPYGDIIIPFLSKNIESPMDISALYVKKGEEVGYISLLKLIIKNNNVIELNKSKSKVVSEILS